MSGEEKSKIIFNENPNRPGTVVFCAYADPQKLRSIFDRGIVPRLGTVRAQSYFPDKVSLSVVGRWGFQETTGINLGWTTLYQNSFVYESFDWTFNPYAFILSDKWLRTQVSNLTCIGEGVIDGSVTMLSFLKGIKVTKDEEAREVAFYEELHFGGGSIPPDAIAGVLINVDSDIDLIPAYQRLHTSYLQTTGSILRHMPVYRSNGELLDVLVHS